MRLNELKTRGHALLLRFVRRNAIARLFVAGEYQKGNEILIAYTGSGQVRATDLGGNVSHAIDWLTSINFTPPACDGEQVTRRFSWVAYCIAHIAKQSPAMLSLPDCSHLLCRWGNNDGASHV
jgi:hypothetical protein